MSIITTMQQNTGKKLIVPSMECLEDSEKFLKLISRPLTNCWSFCLRYVCETQFCQLFDSGYFFLCCCKSLSTWFSDGRWSKQLQSLRLWSWNWPDNQTPPRQTLQCCGFGWTEQNISGKSKRKSEELCPQNWQTLLLWIAKLFTGEIVLWCDMVPMGAWPFNRCSPCTVFWAVFVSIFRNLYPFFRYTNFFIWILLTIQKII